MAFVSCGADVVHDRGQLPLCLWRGVRFEPQFHTLAAQLRSHAVDQWRHNPAPGQFGNVLGERRSKEAEG